MKTVRSLVHQVNRFAILATPLYIVPARTNTCPTPSHGLTLPSKPSPAPRLPSAHTTLNILAPEVLKFGLVYPDTRDIFHQKKTFLFVRKSPSAQIEQKDQDLACLKELNRLARLVELTSSHKISTPIYPSYNPISYHFQGYRYGHKNLLSPVAHKLRTALKLTDTDTFASAFPATSIPKIKMLLNRPRIDKEIFSSLLVTKLNQARAYFCLSHTPKFYPTMITLWLTSLLRNTHTKPKPLAAPKKTKKVDSRKEKIPTTLSERFEPPQSVAEEKAPARSPSPPPPTENRSEVYLTEKDLPDLSSSQLRTDFMNSLFPNDTFSYPTFLMT